MFAMASTWQSTASLPPGALTKLHFFAHHYVLLRVADLAISTQEDGYHTYMHICRPEALCCWYGLEADGELMHSLGREGKGKEPEPSHGLAWGFSRIR